MDTLKHLFLEEGAQTAESVARWLAEIIAAARVSIDLAIYDCHLDGESRDILVGALLDRQRAGVAIRILYNAPRTFPSEGVSVDPSHPDRTAAFFEENHLPAQPVGDGRGGSHLMHHKYLLVDGGTPAARLWTGSANLTTAAFTRQENNLLAIASPTLVAAYAADFEELWRTGEISRLGRARRRRRRGRLRRGEGRGSRCTSRPGTGSAIDREVAARIRDAQRDVTVASVVLSSGHILEALAGLAARKVPLSGIVDLGQMTGILEHWHASAPSAWKADTFAALVEHGSLHGKESSASFLTGPHDYMHNKVIVVDDTVITGSYNYSINAEGNAENILFIESPALARAYRAYIEQLVARYPRIRRTTRRRRAARPATPATTPSPPDAPPASPHAPAAR